jgi:radical SAM protein (TIGR01212 family)
MKKLYTFGKYLKKKFNTTVYKVPISIPGFTCPNIDGTVARGGCVFCENESFSPNLSEKNRFTLNLQSRENPLLEKQLKALEEQFYSTIERLQTRYKAKKFIVYFQSFTNTYAPFETLKALYEKALSFDDVIGLSIGTRTDSITEETLEYLASLSKTKEIWIEYGIQTSNDRVLERINRGHDFENVKKWVEKTKKYDLNICGHLIFGLPDESKEEMKQSIKDTIALDINSIKIHPMYVTENTLLTNDYKKGSFIPISEEDYSSLVVETIKALPDDVSIQRLTAGIDTLLAPSWCKDKGKQISFLIKKLKENGIKV